MPTIHNIYGMTETSRLARCARSACVPCRGDSGALSVGVRPFNTVVRGSPRDGNAGRRGGGVHGGYRVRRVVPGYWNKPDKTAESMPDGAISDRRRRFMDADGWFYIVDHKKDAINASRLQSMAP